MLDMLALIAYNNYAINASKFIMCPRHPAEKAVKMSYKTDEELKSKKRCVDPTPTKIIYTKQPFSWRYAYVYLGALRNMRVMNDRNFARKFNDLYNYVHSKMYLPSDGDIIDSYIVVEQKPVDDADYDNWVANNFN